MVYEVLKRNVDHTSVWQKLWPILLHVVVLFLIFFLKKCAFSFYQKQAFRVLRHSKLCACERKSLSQIVHSPFTKNRHFEFCVTVNYVLVRGNPFPMFGD